MELEQCGEFLLFLWMEEILTDSQYYQAIEKWAKKMKQKECEE